MTRGTRRALFSSLLALVALVLGVILAGYLMLVMSVPVTEGTVKVRGLLSDVEITFDSLGIPQIWAETETDAYFGLGYQHAADRLFQMELTRRVSQGRLSEMLGEVTLEYDIEQRRVGHSRSARKALPNLSESNRARLAAYADGINAYVAVCRTMPFEFYLLPTGFDDWTIHDCLTSLSFQCWFSDALQNNDRYAVELSEALGPDTAQMLLKSYPDWAPVTVPEKEPHGSLDSPSSLRTSVARSLYSGTGPPFRLTGASNAWVVAPHRSESGRAMLASDPHLELGRLPQFWYAVGLHIAKDSVDVIGITTPGLPFVVMGHNGRAAWAFTAAGIDITDYYAEEINPHDRSQYLVEDGYRSFEYVADTIPVAGRDAPEILTTRLTRHGPVLMESDSTDRVYSFRWAGYDSDLNAAVGAGFELAGISGFEQFRSIVTSFGALDANWMYTDSAGNIGYQLGTPVPVRAEGNGDLPYPGWSDDYEWQGYLSLDETPHSLNPARGWLANCNNEADRSRAIRGSYAADRILSITELLSSRERFSVANMQSFQTDLRDKNLIRWKDLLAEALDSLGRTDVAADVRAWDGSTDEESRITPLMLTFLTQLRSAVFKDELGDYSSAVSRTFLDDACLGHGSPWIDDVTTPDSVESPLTAAMTAAQEAATLVGDRSWGQMHTLTMQHPMAVVPVLGGLLDLKRGPWPRGGTTGALCASFYRRRDDTTYVSIVGPSWRFIVDFSDVDAATMVLPAGNSGNPMSPHFFDFNAMLHSGERWQVPLRRDRVYAGAVSVLCLKPESE